MRRTVAVRTGLVPRSSELDPGREPEREGRAMQRLTFEEHSAECSRRLCAMLHDLQGERGAWAAEH